MSDDDGNGQLDRFEMEAMATSRDRAAAEARRKALVVEDGSLERKYMTSSGNAQSLQFVGKNAAPVPRAPTISTRNQRARPISARNQKSGTTPRVPSDDASTSRISTQAAMIEARYRPQSARRAPTTASPPTARRPQTARPQSARTTTTKPVKAVVTTFGLVGKRLRESNPGAHLGCEVPLER